MNEATRREILEEIEVSEMMVHDLDRLWKSYAKKALVAKQERELKAAKKGFLQFETVEELIESYGYADISEEDYIRGIEYFEKQNLPPKLSSIEQHRKKIKSMLDSAKGTVLMLKGELEESKPKNTEENAFEKIDRLEREERYKSMSLGDICR